MKREEALTLDGFVATHGGLVGLTPLTEAARCRSRARSSPRGAHRPAVSCRN